MKKKRRYFTIYYTVYDSIGVPGYVSDEVNIVEIDGNYPSRDLTVKRLKETVYKHHGYVKIVITNIIEYKNKSDYMDYILPLE